MTCKICDFNKDNIEFHWHTKNIRRRDTCILCRSDLRKLTIIQKENKRFNLIISMKW